jgi:CrcB protein
MQTVLITTFGAVGVLLRVLMTSAVETNFFIPISIFLVNVCGSLAMGLLYTSQLIPEYLKTPLMVGLLGGFTTFSSFSLDTVKLLEEQKIFLAVSNIFLQPMICVFVCWLGNFFGKRLFL